MCYFPALEHNETKRNGLEAPGGTHCLVFSVALHGSFDVAVL
jgi:hypothetical protein